MSTRWDPFNVFALCHSCNQRDVRDHVPYRDWFIKTFGQTRFDLLEEKANLLVKWQLYELEDLLKYFRKEEKKYA